LSDDWQGGDESWVKTPGNVSYILRIPGGQQHYNGIETTEPTPGFTTGVPAVGDQFSIGSIGGATGGLSSDSIGGCGGGAVTLTASSFSNTKAGKGYTGNANPAFIGITLGQACQTLLAAVAAAARVSPHSPMSRASRTVTGSMAKVARQRRLVPMAVRWGATSLR
jgi:hypothetical protein